MSSDFEGYEQDFAVLTAEITSKIARVPRLPPDEKKQMVANVEKQLEEAKELLEQMDLEVREIPPQSRGMYSNRMRSYKQEMGKLETDFKRSRIAYSDEVRNELLGEDGNSSENQRAHLLDNTERLERSSRRLEAGYQIAVETGILETQRGKSQLGSGGVYSLLETKIGKLRGLACLTDSYIRSSKLAKKCWKISVMTEKRYSEHVNDCGKQMLTWAKAPEF
ncbi:vesicle transport through interaction with t-SNAREs homolog 1A isoform X1 [Talpa occidentalis]|uniref:vesicle transport through interaction with t-SNAREs homolog 1A isoform X1 n=1 Tax=Talpa occidentalis TaxID=50954 RepID=UPI0023F61DFD|nr:vesicle transport through interaction with t-SNAREs homolog 1A isoform X1 [Talpa occidentalis]XP_054546605.1 vesicle transport through interaction with t-SNAREs homolog 1A isoform X1 [Talpa occidentalis]